MTGALNRPLTAEQRASFAAGLERLLAKVRDPAIEVLYAGVLIDFKVEADMMDISEIGDAFPRLSPASQIVSIHVELKKAAPR